MKAALLALLLLTGCATRPPCPDPEGCAWLTATELTALLTEVGVSMYLQGAAQAAQSCPRPRL
jgi:predicted phage tail protein